MNSYALLSYKTTSTMTRVDTKKISALDPGSEPECAIIQRLGCIKNENMLLLGAVS